MKIGVAILLICVCLVMTCESVAPPSWPACYYTAGVLRLPYAEINEPFAAYYELKKNRSRIDYYDLVKTYQIGSMDPKYFGAMYKVAYMSTETAMNVKSCFQVNGTSDSPVLPQTILPDLTGFELIGNVTYNGVECYKWQNTSMVGTKKNVYTLYESRNNRWPVRYEMIGYDSLLGSHYDRYYVDYTDVMIQDSFPDSVFQIDSQLKCTGFPGPGNEHRVTTMNPIREFTHSDDSHVDSMFSSFKEAHGKTYKDDIEHNHRRNNFRHNLRYINSKNRDYKGFTLAVNHLADKHDDELSMMRGRKYVAGYRGYNGGMPFSKAEMKLNIPDQMDWRLFGAVTQVKDQAVCGSCWSFGTTGAVEGAYFLKTGQLVRLSQQQLVDCSWGEGNNGCDGGEDYRAYQWIMKHGLSSEEAYGPYLAVDGMCHKTDVTANMKGYVNITSGDLGALKLAIANKGPISVSIDAAHKSLSFYSNGVYYDPECGNKLENLDHSVLAVGYGTMNGQEYWLIKNSWSTYWGNDGYVLMSQKDNNCGVATAATYVVM